MQCISAESDQSKPQQKQAMVDEGRHWKAGFQDIERGEKLACLWPT